MMVMATAMLLHQRTTAGKWFLVTNHNLTTAHIYEWVPDEFCSRIPNEDFVMHVVRVDQLLFRF